MANTIVERKTPEGENPILAAICEAIHNNDELMRLDDKADFKIGPRAYNHMEKAQDTKLKEILPECFIAPMEIWEAENDDAKIVYIVQKLSDGFQRVLFIEVKYFTTQKIDGYVFPQRECQGDILILN